jgi:hypothetical protein
MDEREILLKIAVSPDGGSMWIVAPDASDTDEDSDAADNPTPPTVGTDTDEDSDATDSPTLPTVGTGAVGHARNPGDTYVERQTYGNRSNLCALHALNNILGYLRFTYAALETYIGGRFPNTQGHSTGQRAGNQPANTLDYRFERDQYCDLGFTFVISMLAQQRENANQHHSLGQAAVLQGRAVGAVWASPLGYLCGQGGRAKAHL